MQETTRSLSRYFIVSGLLGILLGAAMLPTWSDHAFLASTGLINLLLSLAYIRVGANLSKRLAENPALPLRLVSCSCLVSTLSLNIFSALFSAYMLSQLRRLARQTDIVPESRVLR